MNETNLNWDDLRLFLAVARHGGLVGASAETGKSPPTLGRRILVLEKLLAVALFERSVRGYELTKDGLDLYAKVLLLEKDLQPVLSAASAQGLPRVKVSAGVWVTHLLCHHLKDFKDSTVQFISTNLVLDITHRETIIGIRNKAPTNPALVRQALQQVEFAVYANSVEINTWARVMAATPSANWVQANVGTDKTIEVTDPRNALDLAITGVAKTVLPTFTGDAQPALIRVSDVIDELRHQQWLVLHQDERHRPEVRRVLSWIKSVLGDQTTL